MHSAIAPHGKAEPLSLNAPEYSSAIQPSNNCQYRGAVAAAITSLSTCLQRHQARLCQSACVLTLAISTTVMTGAAFADSQSSFDWISPSGRVGCNASLWGTPDVDGEVKFVTLLPGSDIRFGTYYCNGRSGPPMLKCTLRTGNIGSLGSQWIVKMPDTDNVSSLCGDLFLKIGESSF